MFLNEEILDSFLLFPESNFFKNDLNVFNYLDLNCFYVSQFYISEVSLNIVRLFVYFQVFCIFAIS